jgi:hypothetical protein
MTIRINNWRAKVKLQVFIGLFIMWLSIFLYAGASLYSLGLYEQTFGLILFAGFLGLVGAFVASLDIRHEVKEVKD